MSIGRWTLAGLLMAVGGSAHAAGDFIASHVQVDGRDVAFQVFVPKAWTPEREWPWCFLHGSGERGSDNEVLCSRLATRCATPNFRV